MSPSITVVIPVKDDADVLQRCLQSLAAQTRVADEIIVVDNGSTDASAAVAREFGARVVIQLGGGIPAASAAGYDAASGEIIARLDADCLPPVTWLADLHRELLAHPEAVALTGAAHFIDGPRWLRTPLAALYLGSYFLTMRAALGHIPLFGSNLAMRRSAWLEVKDAVHRNDPLVHDDVDLSMHLGPIRELIFSTTLSMGISMRPFGSLSALIYRFRRGQYTLTRHWPGELPPLRYLRRATGNASLGTSPRIFGGTSRAQRNRYPSTAPEARGGTVSGN
ncbi:MAG: glycosyltransferase family 2 protein [Microbacteriaceae bacterium]|nr:glycosyltransferase family 2 protein [Microbacteriaceae bacterium]